MIKEKKTLSKRPVMLIDNAVIRICLFLSGFCGISYEVLYSRLLGNLIGNHFAVNASLLVTFLLGIGLGTKLAYRLSRYLWAVEGSIGIYAILFTLSSPLLDKFLFHVIASGSMTTNIVVSCILLAVPAFLVGVSLPLFSAYFKNLVGGGQSFSLCYMVYNFGAAITAIAIEFYLIRTLGISASVYAIGMLNLCIALMLFLRRENIKPDLDEKKTISYPKNIIIALVLMSVASAVFQLLFLKFSEFIFGPFNETFAMVLTIVLLGIAIGTLLNRWFSISFLSYLLINLIFLTVLIPMFWSILKCYATYHSTFAGAGIIAWKMTIMLLMMGCSSICFGAAIPALIKEESDIAKESGHLLYISSLANVAGYLLMVFFLHSMLEYGQILVLITTLLAVAAWIISWPQKIIGIASLIIALGGGIFLLKTTWNEDLLYLDYTSFTSPEDLHEEVLSYQSGKRFRKFDETFAINTIDGAKYFFINGYTSIRLDSSPEYIVGVLSTLVAPRTKQGLVLGLGSGATAGTVAEVFDELDVIEISPIIIEKQHLMKEYGFNISDKEQVSISCDDGARYVKSTDKKYDLILNTVTSPLYFSSSKLYTCDFFHDIKSALSPDGIYTTWLDYRVGDYGVQIILKSLQKEFKYCWLGMLRGQYFLLLCSNEPIELRQEEKVYSNKRLRDYFLREHGREIHTYRYAFLSANAYEYLPVTSTAPLNTNDLPALEFEIARLEDRGLGSFKKKIRNSYSIERMNREVFTNPPLDLYDMLTYNMQVKRSSSFTKLFRKIARKEDRKSNTKLKRHLLALYRRSAQEFPLTKRKADLASWLSYYDKDDETEVILRGILKEEPTFYAIREKIGRACYWQKKYAEAEIAFKDELLHHPHNTDAMYRLGRIKMKTRQYAEAVNWFEKCLELNPWYDNANYYAGLSCIEDGNKNRAKNFFLRELVVDPEDDKPKKYLE